MDVILCVSNDLSADQRLHKMALTITELNATTLLLGRQRKTSTKLNTRPYKTHRLKLFFDKKAFFYAELNIRIFFYLLFHSYKIAVANDMDTLPAVFLAAKIKRKKIVFDSHEIFSEVPELIKRKKIKIIWKKLEDLLIPKVDFGITVCHSIAKYYNSKYHKPFIVVPNLPIEQKIIPKSKAYFHLPEKQAVLIYQGALNKARGIELMIDSLKYLENWILVIAGKGDLENELKARAKQSGFSNQIIFMGQLDFSTLKSLTSLADIGLSLEEDFGLNYRYALPNKIFDYAQAQIPAIVSDLPEMANWIKTTQVGEILTVRSPEELAKRVKKTYIKKQNNFYTENFKNTFRQLFWTNNKKKLHNLYKPLIL